MDENEILLKDALQNMILTAIKRGRTEKNDYVILSIDLLAKLDLITPSAKEILFQNQKQ